MTSVTWGVLSSSDLAIKQVIPAMRGSQYSDVRAIASRTLEKAQAVASSLGIATAYGSYEALLADPDIAVIYNPLPNHMHVPWTIKALEAGKHVLCEKPIAPTAADTVALTEAMQRFPHLKVMEAFMYRFHPQWQIARDAINRGEIGQIQAVTTHFSYYLDDPTNIRNIPEVGGGALLDIGCYATSVARYIFDAEPVRVSSVIDFDPAMHTDRLVSGILDFGVGQSIFLCGTQTSNYQRVDIFGSQGRVEIEIPFNAPPDRPCKVWITTEQGTREEQTVISNQYALQADAFSLSVLNDSAVPTPLSDAIANMRVLDALLKSGQQGEWVTL